MDELNFYELINDDEFVLISNEFDLKNKQEEEVMRELSGEIVDKIIDEILEEVIQEVYITKQPTSEKKIFSESIQMELQNERGDTVINFEENNKKCDEYDHCKCCKYNSSKKDDEYHENNNFSFLCYDCFSNINKKYNDEGFCKKLERLINYLFF